MPPPSNDPAAAPTALVLVLTTEADAAQAERLAQALLEERLAVCISLLPITSLYHWQGRIERSTEVQLLIKTSATQLEPLRQRLGALHSYDTPEWIHWQAQTKGAYGLWLQGELAGSAQMQPHQLLQGGLGSGSELGDHQASAE
jgi:periplasmic divalent cation tolerance protein